MADINFATSGVSHPSLSSLDPALALHGNPDPTMAELAASFLVISDQTQRLQQVVDASPAALTSTNGLSAVLQGIQTEVSCISARLHTKLISARKLLRLSQRLDLLETTRPHQQMFDSLSPGLSLPSFLDPAPSISKPAGTSAEMYPAARAKNRRVQLSKAVRTTMLDMMGLASSSQDLPDYDDSYPKFAENGKKVWRWEWSKTMTASSVNSDFAEAIFEKIDEQRRSFNKFTDVPEEDWESLKKAIDTAYINLRREYDSRTNEDKRARKEQTRRRNRRRGLRDEKFKRRKQALEHLNAAGAAKLQVELDSSGITDAMLAQQALDIKYMSSEESELEDPTAGTSNEFGIGSPATDQGEGGTSTKSGLKVFRIRPPVWRAKPFGKFFERLDLIKPPERAYKRVKGDPREEALPPDGTPVGLVDPEWRTAHPEWPKVTKGRKRKVDVLE
jgi:hypothetical protein